VSDTHERDRRTLDALVREEREARGTAADVVAPSDADDARMAELEARLMAAVASDQASRGGAARAAAATDVRAARGASGGRGSMGGGTARRVRTAVQVGAVVFAAAAAVTVFVRREAGPTGPVTATPTATTPSPGEVVAADRGVASELRGAEGSGVVRVEGRSAAAGQVLRAGDRLEADGARAVLERAGKVSWLLESDRDLAQAPPLARAEVKAAGESLVLALEQGVIEAQVTPVLSGEAFAVDVAAGTDVVRVAVHGTHLRVTRRGTKVMVDLTEGVVSIGLPPRSGLTVGALVTAPAHVELDVRDVAGSIRVDHEASRVRAAIPLGPSRSSTTAAGGPHAADPAKAPSDRHAAPAASPGLAPGVPRPANLPAAPSRLDPSAPRVPARDAIAAAVRQCAARHAQSGDVRVTVTSTLRLRVAPSGAVESARFDPPLLPDIQTCAAPAIYESRLDPAEGDTATVPIAFSY